MKYWLPLLFLTFTQLYGFDKYKPVCKEYSYLPPSTDISDCGKLFFSGDLCYFRPASDGQVFGTEYFEGDDLESIGSVKRLYFPTSYDFGFRLLAGYSLPGDQWAGSVNWLWYQSTQRAYREDPGFGSSRKGGSFFQPGLNNIAMSGNVTFPLSSSGMWRLKFNQIDLDASRDFLVGPAWTVRPTVGLRIVKLNEEVHYTSTVTSIPETNYLKSQLTGNFNGYGPSIGCENFLELGFGLGGFLSTKLALLVANQKQKQTLNAPFAIDPFDLSAVQFNNETTALKAALDFAVGLEWRMSTNRDLHFFFVRVAFEDHLIFQALEYPYVDSDSGYVPAYNRQPHDFALFGFSVSIGFTI